MAYPPIGLVRSVDAKKARRLADLSRQRGVSSRPQGLERGHQTPDWLDVRPEAASKYMRREARRDAQ